LTLTSPGFAPPLPVLAQAVFVSAAGGIGCTPPVALLLGP
jgi:hypothetical protein